MPPLGATPTAFGSAVPKADPTVAPVGHTEDALDAVGVAAAAVGEAVAAGPDVVGPVVDPPQPASVAVKASAISGIQRQLLPVRWNVPPSATSRV